MIDGERHVGRARDRERLAVVEALELRELLRQLLDAVGQLPEQAPALGRVHAPPGALVEGAPRGGHRALDVRGPSLRDLRDAALLRGVLDGEAAAVGRGREAPSDQQAVLLGQEGPDRSKRGGNRGGAGGRHGVDLSPSGGSPDYAPPRLRREAESRARDGEVSPRVSEPVLAAQPDQRGGPGVDRAGPAVVVVGFDLPLLVDDGASAGR